jgi:DNA-binding IclR family transcriptional regulator
VGIDTDLTVPAGTRVLQGLVAQPNEDTPSTIAQRTGLSIADVDATLVDLKRQHLVRRWGEIHWQATGMGADAVAANGSNGSNGSHA